MQPLDVVGCFLAVFVLALLGGSSAGCQDNGISPDAAAASNRTQPQFGTSGVCGQRELFDSLCINLLAGVLGLCWWLCLKHHAAGRLYRFCRDGLRAHFTPKVAAPLLVPETSSSFPTRASFRRGLTMEEAHAFNNEANTQNYLMFLQVCVYMFASTTLANLVLLCLAGDFGRSFVMASPVHMNLGFALLVFFVDGFVALLYIQLLEAVGYDRVLENATHYVVERTVWLTRLPQKDSQTGSWFELNDAHFEEVRMALVKSLNDQLDVNAKRPQNRSVWTERSLEEAIQELERTGHQVKRPDEQTKLMSNKAGSVIKDLVVTQVVDDWEEVDKELKKTRLRLAKREEQKKAAEESNSTRSWCWAGILSRRVRHLNEKKVALEEQLSSIERSKKRLSGSAFVTFNSIQDRDKLLQPGPGRSPWVWGSGYTYFSFGRPPFGSVTLRCHQAPPPDDVIWTNLHISMAQRRIRYWSSVVGIVILGLLLTFPTAFLSASGPIERLMRQALESYRQMMETSPLGPHSKAFIEHIMDAVANKVMDPFFAQLPTIFISLVNTVILPYLIEGVGTFARSPQKSKFERDQRNLNFGLLFATTILFPFLGVALADAGLSWLTSLIDKANRNVWGLARRMAKSLQGSVGIFGMKYLVYSSFLSCTLALLNVFQWAGKLISRRFAVTESEVKEINQPWPFAWGYWYAWSLTIFSLALILGIFMPSMLPMAAVFFFIRHRVDRNNLEHKVYSSSADFEGTLLLGSIRIMRVVVGGMWVMMGLICFFSHHVLGVKLRDHDVDAVLGAMLALAGVVVIVLAYLAYHHRNAMTRVGRWKPGLVALHQLLCFYGRWLGLRDDCDDDLAEAQDDDDELGRYCGHIHWHAQRHLGLQS